MSFQKILPLFVFALAAGVAGAAAATIVDNVPGGHCLAAAGAPLTLLDDGQAANESGAEVTAVCPAERSMQPLSRRLSGRVFVVDRHPSEEVCCRAFSKNPSGTLKVAGWSCSSGSSSGYQILELPELYDPYSFSHFAFECKVPATYNGNASRIQTYRVIQES